MLDVCTIMEALATTNNTLRKLDVYARRTIREGLQRLAVLVGTQVALSIFVQVVATV